jgi:glycosyltransferase involved in cell wall biosynthesis
MGTVVDLRPHETAALSDAEAFAPVAVVEVELAGSIPAIAATDDDVRYGSARVVARLHGKTIGVADLPLDGIDLSAQACAAGIWAALGERINAHLDGDGLAAVSGLQAGGLPVVAAPPCDERRAAVLRAPLPATVIICTRNRADLIGRTLASLQELEYPDVDVLVIDGSADDATAAVVREQFPQVGYLNVHPYGRSVALNRGVEAARGQILAFTDDDVRVDRRWLAELVTGFDDPRVACVTGVAFPMELHTQAQLWFEESGAFTDGFAPRKIGLDLAQPGSLLPFATGKIGAGVSMAWRRDVLEQIGGFDVALDTLTPVWPPRASRGSSAEDLAAFFDAIVLGHRIAFEPNAIVYHEHRRDLAALHRQIYWHGLGLSAYLVRSLLRRPDQLPTFLARTPRGIAYGFGTSSVRNDKKSARFPASLTRAEWRGVAEGPLAYLRGLREARRIRASLATGG